MPKKCEHPSSNHSKDLKWVYYGDDRPALLCGYHTTQLTQSLKAIREKANANE